MLSVAVDCSLPETQLGDEHTSEAHATRTAHMEKLEEGTI